MSRNSLPSPRYSSTFFVSEAMIWHQNSIICSWPTKFYAAPPFSETATTSLDPCSKNTSSSS